MIGLTMGSVTWNRFPIKNLWLIPCLFHLGSAVIWIQIYASLNHRKKMKAEPSRLIPLKPIENVELSFVILRASDKKIPTNHAVLLYANQKPICIFRLRTGHCNVKLNNHLFTLVLHPTGLCDYCHTWDTVIHFLTTCPAFLAQRLEFKQATNKLGIVRINTKLPLP